MYLSTKQPENTFSKDVNLSTYSRGMGALGLPGDLSSASRFVRVAFTNMNVTKGLNEQENVSQFFHILGSDYSLVIAPVVADLCTTPVALSAPPNSYQNNSQS